MVYTTAAPMPYNYPRLHPLIQLDREKMVILRHQETRGYTSLNHHLSMFKAKRAKKLLRNLLPIN